jgi:hypothetical protein
MADNKSKQPTFSVGPAAKRELKRALVKSTNPAETISNFQKTRSLHSMLARAFGTQPQHADEEDKKNNDTMAEKEAESLDTDSVLTFLTHLGVAPQVVHKRITDSLQKQLEDEIRKTSSHEPLLNLLKSCWPYATILPELRSILWAVLKQLGDQTPLAVLKALGERESSSSDGKLKHPDIFRPLPPLLKRLVWEADWDDKVPLSTENNMDNPKQFLKLLQSTLLCETVQPLIVKYTTNAVLHDSVKKPFVSTARERRVLTTQRRALVSSTSTTTTTSSLVGAKLSAATTSSSTATTTAATAEPLLTSGKAVSQLRQFLGDATGGTASYRPKLLHAILQLLMATHGNTKPNLLGPHLHCTLLADILLSAAGPLPKAYTHVHSLARTLDDAVKLGVLSDADLIHVQATVALIFEQDEETPQDNNNNKASDDKQGGKDNTTSPSKNKKKKKQKNEKEDAPNGGGSTTVSTFLKRQLNRIITAGLVAMKDADPQTLFLNPVTDAIAPGYSKVIKKPMCICTMEEKLEDFDYNSIQEWDADVKLMFKNCVDYNRGPAGQWFRGEANRQHKVYKDEILSQAKKLYAVEVAKRNPDDESHKRKREEVQGPKIPKIAPLPAADKKRKKETHEYTPSMPALAAMLLADPFVVRLMLDRVLRSLRIDILKGTSLPAAHGVIPSLLQLLHMAQWSTKICALRGRRYVVPDAGLTAPTTVEAIETMVPYHSLRRYLPILMHLLLEAELDKRLVAGGDLNPVVQSLERPAPPSISIEHGSSAPLQVVVSLLEGAFVYICLPGISQDDSLSVTFSKFATTLQKVAGNVWEERAFFTCLVANILRHKARLNRTNRDVICSTWMDWLRTTNEDDDSTKKKKKKGCMTSAAHEFFIYLINEWAALGNLLMPRDLLLKTTAELVQVVNGTETANERKFVAMWQQEEAGDFEPIQAQYKRMLGMLPEANRIQWKDQVGIAQQADAKDEEMKDATSEPATVEEEVDAMQED